jgi:hypothetical protein
MYLSHQYEQHMHKLTDFLTKLRNVFEQSDNSKSRVYGSFYYMPKILTFTGLFKLCYQEVNSRSLDQFENLKCI